jgi:uncharacterized membrane protein YphA (DoxX/SURF4 family)
MLIGEVTNIFQYMQLINPDGNLLSFEFISRVALLTFLGLILIAVGFKIKVILGAAVAVMLGTLFFLYNQEILKF